MSNQLFPALIGNNITLETDRYAAILGLSPSKGARSPLLWNAAFAKAGIDAVMHPFDVTEDKLADLVSALKADPRYLGGAVAVPHKTGLVPLLDRLEPEAARIGAVNAIYRDGGDLVGANTDGAGALASVQAACPDLAERNAVLVGLGGAGMAVAAYLSGNVASLTLANRTGDKAEAYAARLGGAVSATALPLSPEQLSNCQLLVNCSSVGYQDGDAGAPVSDDALASLPDNAFVYDIIYQPLETALLAAARKRGLRGENGLAMNMDQAVIAFEKANPGALDADAIRAAMADAG